MAWYGLGDGIAEPGIIQGLQADRGKGSNMGAGIPDSDSANVQEGTS